MRRGEIMVRARHRDGRYGPLDVLHLSDESFRVFVLDILKQTRLMNPMRNASGEVVELEQQPRVPVRTRKRRIVRKKVRRKKATT